MLEVLISLISCAYYHEYEEKSFLLWMRSTNQYFTGEEYQMRFGIFLTNLRFVKEHNGANKKFTVTINKFSAYTPSEYKSLLGYKMDCSPITSVKTQKKTNSDSVDWRDKGVVNEIKDQGLCGSCWAFSAIQAAESANAIKTGTFQGFSEQNLVDCCHEGCAGCSGGLMTQAYKYVIAQQGGHFNFESDYQYTALEGTCLFTKYAQVGSISKYVNIAKGDEDDLAAKIETYGPVAVAIDASHVSLQQYSSGIYDEPDCSPANLNHGVGCVGFGSQDGVKYWIVRNSWGKEWGENGYVKMIWKNNQCGIASRATLPLV